MAGTSRVNREIYARICGRLEVRFLRPTRRCGNGVMARLLGHRQTKGTDQTSQTYCYRATSLLYRIETYPDTLRPARVQVDSAWIR